MDERERVNKNAKQDQQPRGKKRGNDDRDNESKGNIEWDARDLEGDAWISDSPRSNQGEYTSRYHEE